MTTPKAPLLDVQPMDMSWREEAACLGTDTEAFFHNESGRGRGRHDSEAEAKAICGRCDVATRCVIDAVRMEERDGIRGGLDFSDPKDRKRARVIADRHEGAVA